MRPIPETDEALDEYLEEDGSDLRAHLSAMAATAVGVVPSCVGLSLGLVTEGLTFTFVASAEEVALIDVACLPGAATWTRRISWTKGVGPPSRVPAPSKVSRAACPFPS